MAKAKIKAVAYVRTSSLTNVGSDKDSERRQRSAIARFAKSGGYIIADQDWFADPGVSGADPIETRPGFLALLARIESNGVRTVIIEDASRFARDLTTQELGIALMIERGVKVIASNGDDLTVTDDPMRKAMRQIAGAFSELEKSRLVAKLKSGRERKAQSGGRSVGRLPIDEKFPEATELARKLAHGNLIKKRSLRTIAQLLAAEGHVSASGEPFSPSVIAKMIGDKQ